MSSQSSITPDKERAETFEHGTVPVEEGPHIEGNVQLIDTAGKLRLVPSPSLSPRDPLNWSKWRKAGVFIACIWFSIMSLSVVGGFGALAGYFYPLYAAQGVSIAHITRLLTWPSLFIGLGNFLFLPMSLCFGRRPVFLISGFLMVGSTIWAAKSGTSFQSHFGARLLMGFSTGITESLLPLMITDMTFIHQRSLLFGVYWVCQNVFTAVFNTASGYEAVNLSWPWYYWIFTIFAGVGMIFAVFFLPETKFSRPAFAMDGQLTIVDAYGNLVAVTEEEAKAQAGSDDGDNMEPLTFAETLKPFDTTKFEKSWIKVWAMSYYYMATSLLNPAIVWCLGASATVLGTNVGTGLVFATILSSKYGWSTEETGLMYLGGVPAGLFALVVSGWAGDKINLALARRNNGVHLPEHRLPALIFPVVSGVAISFAYGYWSAWAPKLNVTALIFGFNYLIFLFVAVLITTTTYAVEVMTQHSGAALVMVVGGKNLLAFAMSTAIVPLMDEGNYSKAQNILTGTELAWLSLGIPLYFLMPRLRQALARRG